MKPADYEACLTPYRVTVVTSPIADRLGRIVLSARWEKLEKVPA